MKSMKLHYLFAAAALAAVAASASAQILMKAEIPFTFRAGQSSDGPRVVWVRAPVGSSSYVTLRNIDTGKSVIAVYQPTRSTRTAARSQPRLTFACAASRCALQQVWPGGCAPRLHAASPEAGFRRGSDGREVPLSRVTN